MFSLWDKNNSLFKIWFFFHKFVFYDIIVTIYLLFFFFFLFYISECLFLGNLLDGCFFSRHSFLKAFHHFKNNSNANIKIYKYSWLNRPITDDHKLCYYFRACLKKLFKRFSISKINNHIYCCSFVSVECVSCIYRILFGHVTKYKTPLNLLLRITEQSKTFVDSYSSLTVANEYGFVWDKIRLNKYIKYVTKYFNLKSDTHVPQFCFLYVQWKTLQKWRALAKNKQYFLFPRY